VNKNRHLSDVQLETQDCVAVVFSVNPSMNNLILSTFKQSAWLCLPYDHPELSGGFILKTEHPRDGILVQGPGSYSAPSTAPGRARPSPAFQDKQDRFDRPVQTMVPPVNTYP